MRTTTSQWFEVAFRYDKTQEDGTVKAVTEQFVVDALSFSEAETAIAEEMSPYVSGVCSVKAMRRAAFTEVLFSDKMEDDKWYKVKLLFNTIDEKTEKEKKQYVVHLVQAADIDHAKRAVTELYDKAASEYTVVTVTETKIMDVFEHN